MAVVLAATYPELFAAVGVHSAPPYRSASSPANALAAMQGHALQPPVEATAIDAMPPMIIFQGTLDSTVRSVNAQRIADQWLAYYAHAAKHPSFARTAGAVRPDRPTANGDDEARHADLGPQPPRFHRQSVVRGRQQDAGVVDRRRPGSCLVGWIAQGLLQRLPRTAGDHRDVEVLQRPPIRGGDGDRGGHQGRLTGRPRPGSWTPISPGALLGQPFDAGRRSRRWW